MAIHELHVDSDHIASLAKGSPTLAIAELLWNAWDADAENISVKIARTDLTGIDKVIISDDGKGLDGKDPEVLFTRIGGSWKTHEKRTHSGRPIHGERGKGRLRALAVGNQIVWKMPDRAFGKLHTITLNGASINKISLESTELDQASNTKSIVEISEIGDRAGELLNIEKVESILAPHFAIPLKNHPHVTIKYDGKQLNPSILIEEVQTIQIPLVHNSIAYNSTLEIVNWKHKTERRLFVCDNKGRILHDVEVKVRPGSAFNFSAYIKSDDFLSSVGDSNDIIFDEIGNKIIDEARCQIRNYFREKKAAAASGLVKSWKEEGIYPFFDDSSDPIELVKRQVFDICAYNIHEFLDGFGEQDTQSRKLTFLMLSEAINEHPSALKRIFEQVLKLPKDKLDDLADILEQNDISKVIEATRMALSRLSFLDGLNTLIFNDEISKQIGEKHHLHSILEREPWIFGEEYSLAASEVTLTTLLKRHLPKLRPGEDISSVKSTTGKDLRIDMLLGCEIGTGHKDTKEFLVVELKRPSVDIGIKEQNQIREYAHAVSEDPQFDKANTKWTFLIIGKELHPIVEQDVNQDRNPPGFFHVKTNLKIGAMTWSQIITKSRARLQWYRDAMNFTLSESDSIAYMQDKYKNYLPELTKSPTV